MKVSEFHIQETCSEWLALDGWRRRKSDPKHLRGLAVQEKGMADDLYIRYHLYGLSDLETETRRRAYADVVWIEWKAKKGALALHQARWRSEERARGALVWTAGIEFPKSIEGFQEFYRNSGLLRRRI